MDIQVLQANSAVATTRSVQSTRIGAGVGDDFASSLAAAQTDAGAAALNRAQEMVGQRISPPPGGCSCQTMATAATSSSMPERGRATVPTLPIGSLLGIGLPVPTTPEASYPGDLLALEGNSNETHFGIVVDATKMIAPDVSGLISLLTIDWNSVRAARRLD